MLVLITVFLFAIFTLFSGIYSQGKYSRYMAILGLLVSFCISFIPEPPFFEKYYHMFYFSKSATLFARICILICIGIFSLGEFTLSDHKNHQSELYSLMLFSLCGGIVILGMESLVTLFIGIEILSIPLYVLAGSKKTNNQSIEASIKYFLMGSFATGFLLFGITLIYGSAESFDLKTIGFFPHEDKNYGMFLMGMLLIVVSLAFKVTLVPFHMWGPDVYDGSPSLVTLFMATIVKTTLFCAFFKLVTTSFSNVLDESQPILYALASITIIFGNILALVQTNIKRIIAYSSISHAGFISLLFFSTNTHSTDILAFYLFVYCISTLGVFLGIIFVEKTQENLSIKSFKGIARKYPVLGITVAISLFSMAGIPLTAGFIGKFYIFKQIFFEYKLLAFIGIVGSVIGIGYYLKVIMLLYMHNDEDRNHQNSVNFPYNSIAILIIVLTISLGIFPKLIDLLNR